MLYRHIHSFKIKSYVGPRLQECISVCQKVFFTQSVLYVYTSRRLQKASRYFSETLSKLFYRRNFNKRLPIPNCVNFLKIFDAERYTAEMLCETFESFKRLICVNHLDMMDLLLDFFGRLVFCLHAEFFYGHCMPIKKNI